MKTQIGNHEAWSTTAFAAATRTRRFRHALVAATATELINAVAWYRMGISVGFVFGFGLWCNMEPLCCRDFDATGFGTHDTEIVRAKGVPC